MARSALLGTRVLIRNFARKVERHSGADLALADFNYDRNDIKNQLVFSMAGGHSLTIFGTLGALALTKGKFAKSIGASMVGLNSWIGAESDPDEIKMFHESGVAQFVNWARGEGKRPIGLLQKTPQEIEAMGPGELTVRIALNDVIDTMAMGGILKAGGAGIKFAGRKAKKATKFLKDVEDIKAKSIEDPEGADIIDDVRKAFKELTGVDVSEKALKNAGEAIDEIDEDFVVMRVSAVAEELGVTEEEALQYIRRGLGNISEGKINRAMADTDFVKLLQATQELAKGTKKLRKIKRHSEALVDIEKKLEEHGPLRPKTKKAAKKDISEQRKTADAKADNTPKKGDEVKAPEDGKPKLVDAGDDVKVAEHAAHLSKLGKRLDSFYKNSDEVLDNLEKGDLTALNKINESLDETIDSMPSTTKTKDLPRTEAIKEVEGATAEEALVGGGRGTGSDITAIIIQKNKMFSMMFDALDGKYSKEVFDSLRKIDRKLNVVASKRASQAGGNLQRYDEFLNFYREVEAMIETAQRIKALGAPAEKWQKPLKQAQKRYKELNKAFEEGKIPGLKAHQHAVRMTYNLMLSMGALGKAVADVAVTPMVQSVKAYGVWRPDYIVKDVFGTYGRMLGKTYKTVSTKQGLKELRDIGLGRRQIGTSRLNLQDMGKTGKEEEIFTAATNLFTGALQAVDYLVDEPLALLAQREVLFDMYQSRIRQGNTPQQAAKGIARIMLGEVDDDGLEILTRMQSSAHINKENMLAKGEVPMSNYVNAEGEGHSLITGLASMFQTLTRTLNKSMEGYQARAVGPIKKTGAGLLRYFTDMGMVFTRTGTSITHYGNDFLPIAGVRENKNVVGFLPSVLDGVKRGTVQMNREQKSMLLVVSGAWAMNEFNRNYGDGGPMIEFKGVDYSSRRNAQFMGKGPEFVWNEQYRLDAEWGGKVGSMFETLHKMHDFFKYPTSGEDEGTWNTGVGLARRAADIVLADSWLSDFTGRQISMLFRGDAEDVIYEGDKWLLPFALVSPLVRAGQTALNRGVRQPTPQTLSEFVGAVKDFVTFSFEQGFGDGAGMRDAFGTSFTKGENVQKTDMYYGALGIFVRSAFPMKGQTPKQDLVMDSMVEWGAFNEAPNMLIGGKSIPKESLPPAMQVTLRPAGRNITLNPSVTGGMKGINYSLPYDLKNERQGFMSWDLDFIHGKIDMYLDYYNAVDIPPGREGEVIKARVEQIKTDLRDLKYNVYSEGSMKTLIHGYDPKKHKDYRLADILAEVTHGSDPLVRQNIERTAADLRSYFEMENRAGRNIKLTESEIRELAEKTAKKYHVIMIYNSTKKVANRLISLHPKVFNDIVKKYKLHEATDNRPH